MLEAQFRCARVQQYRRYGIKLPEEECVRACRRGVAEAEWGMSGEGMSGGRAWPAARRGGKRVVEGEGLSSSEELSEESEELSEESEEPEQSAQSDQSDQSDRSDQSAQSAQSEESDLLWASCAKDVRGFGLADGCADRCVRYHRTIWARYDLTRMVREGILRVLAEKNWSLNNTECTTKVLAALLHESADENPYYIFESLQDHFDDLLDVAESHPVVKEVELLTNKKTRKGDHESRATSLLTSASEDAKSAPG